MGIRSALSLVRRQREVQEGVQGALYYSGGVTDPSKMPFATPWGQSMLEKWVYEDLFGDAPNTTRDAAMRIPAIARGRNLFCTTGGKLPLVELDGPTRLLDQPPWLTRCSDGSTPQHRMVWTIDDAIFYGISCWWRNNNGDGTIDTADRLNQTEWQINHEKRAVIVNGVEAKPNDIILIPGFHEGLLCFGREALSDVRALYNIVRDRLANPVPGVDLHQTGGDELTDEQIDAIIDRWVEARTPGGKRAGVGFTNKWIDAKEMGTSSDSQLMVESRNAAVVDVARMLGIHAGLLDATAPKASLNYETQSGRNQEFLDFDMDLYLEPIAARLSLDDVCPPGHRIEFDRTQFTTMQPEPTGPALED